MRRAVAAEDRIFHALADPSRRAIFESLGLGVEDVAAAHVGLVNAERTGTGTLFDLGGARSRA